MIADLVAGVLDGVRGAAYVARRPSLWKWVVAPAVVVTLVALLAFGWLVAVIGALGLVGWTSLAIACATVIVTFAALVAGPFNELLSQAIEVREAGLAPPPFSVARYLYEVAISIVHAARRGILHIVIIVGLLVIARFVPVVGPVIAAVGTAWLTAWYASYAVYDAIWGRRQWRYRQKLAYLRERRWRTLGLGTLVGAMLVVPGLNVVGLAIGSAGATLRICDEERP